MLEFTMLIGLPGSGKSFVCELIKKQKPFVEIVSTDSIRKELYGSESEQGDSETVFSVAKERIVSYMESYKSVIFDATNMSSKRRKLFLTEIKKQIPQKYHAVYSCYVLRTPIDVCINRNFRRRKTVPIQVIFKMAANFEIPFKEEGWDNIDFSPMFKESSTTLEELLEDSKGFNQDNPNHKYDLYGHLQCCYDNFNVNGNLKYAALFHDIGKLYTKTSTNMKGFDDGKCHYYGHEKFSSYIVLTTSSKLEKYQFNLEDRVAICRVINHHMRPYAWVSQKNHDKYIRQFGKEFYDIIMSINKADISAH